MKCVTVTAYDTGSTTPHPEGATMGALTLALLKAGFRRRNIGNAEAARDIAWFTADSVHDSIDVVLRIEDVIPS